ncbi:hypothetical protein O181_006371 [Austropuccinia psidii MF-1]|uniref:RGS domain-containing protein n=1 Tax=Austropuccinia psidii MF-1 TaxID=1389203 RepID=A0A9Q3BKR9_9BASI|nr:hypothetical protein [Austropuccinia psidii MF-1]
MSFTSKSISNNPNPHDQSILHTSITSHSINHQFPSSNSKKPTSPLPKLPASNLITHSHSIPPTANSVSDHHHNQNHQNLLKSTSPTNFESKPKHSSKKMSRNRLPTLQEVLARQTRPPVDLYCFYLYLQRERAEDSLDFWLDAQQHENLCRAYFKDLRKSTVNLKDEWPAYYKRAKTRGSVYNPINGITRQSKLINQAIQTNEKPIVKNSSSTSPHPIPTNPAALTHASPALRALFPHDNPANNPELDLIQSSSNHTGSRTRNSIQPVIPRSSAITRTDLIASAERIYYRYLLTGAEKEIYLPPSLRIHDFPINSSSLPHVGSQDYDQESSFLAMIPDLFVSQKEYIYRSMERDTFPRFLRSKAFGNLTPLSSLIRLSIGLLAVWVGLSVGLSMIFLDIKPRSRRLWVILPLMIGAIGIIGYFYELDPLLILFNRSETTSFRTLSIKEKYVKKILRGRALWVMIMSLVLVIGLTSILVFVPGHRL